MLLAGFTIILLLPAWIEGKSRYDKASLRNGNHEEESSWRIQSHDGSKINALIGDRASRRASAQTSRKRDISPWVYKAYSSSSSTCQFKCNDGACLPKSDFRCDGYAHCWDGSDEKGCGCDSQISYEKICDGYKDCADGEDEFGCVLGCQPYEFACAKRNTGSKVKCISTTKQCDGYHDCADGYDEHECYKLTDLTEETRGLRSYGILQKKIGTYMYTVCKTTGGSHYVQTYAEKVCQQVVGYTDDPPKITTVTFSSIKPKLSKQQLQDIKFIRLADSESKFGVLSSCASDRLYQVECPMPKCGGVGNNKESERRKRAEPDVVDTEGVDDDDDDDDDVDLSFLDDEDEVETVDSEKEFIVGGYDTQEMEWPFLVAIYRNGEFYCGGSIINERWIMTAAHCTHKYEQNIYEVQAGMIRRNSFSPYEQTRDVEEIHVHEYYDGKIFANDIALFKLDRPLYMSKYVTPACLPEGYDDDPKGGQVCKVAGWGDLEEGGGGPDHLQEVQLPVLNECLESFTRDEYQICAGYLEGGKDACQEKPYTGSRPKQCSEKCYKPGGACLFQDEKCSGTVECLGAEDERDCYHAVMRNGGASDNGQSSSQISSFWTNQKHTQYRGAEGRGVEGDVRGRAGGGGGEEKQANKPVSTVQKVGRPAVVVESISSSGSSSGTTVCAADEFQCQTKGSTSGCLPHVNVCDGVTNCVGDKDETQCISLTRDFNEPLIELNNGELKGFVMVRYQGLSWHPLALDVWSLELGSVMCAKLIPGGQLETLETIEASELAKRLRTFSLMESTVVKISTAQELNRLTLATQTVSRIAKVELSDGENPVEAENSRLGFLRCSASTRLSSALPN